MAMKFYWYHFADGYRVCVRSLSAQERRAEERTHGKFLYRVQA